MAADGPLVAVDDAADAPPMVVAVSSERARVHLLCSAPLDTLGEPVGELGLHDVETLQAAVQLLVGA